jgi:putative membrane protein
LNSFVKPILKMISFPITSLTLGLFSLVINVGLVYLVEA